MGRPIHVRLCSGWRGDKADVGGGDVGGQRGDLLAEFANAIAEDRGAQRRLAEPERKRGRRAVGVFDQHAPSALDALNAPARIAQQDDIAGAGIHCEVLVECGDL